MPPARAYLSVADSVSADRSLSPKSVEFPRLGASTAPGRKFEMLQAPERFYPILKEPHGKISCSLCAEQKGGRRHEF
jgi:hypothetical protein